MLLLGIERNYYGHYMICTSSFSRVSMAIEVVKMTSGSKTLYPTPGGLKLDKKELIMEKMGRI